MELYELLRKPTYLFDSHCHLNSKEFEGQIDEVVLAAKGRGVERIYDIGVDIESSRRSLEISNEFDSLKSFVGIDPDVLIPGSELYAGDIVDNKWIAEQGEMLEKLVYENRESVFGIGETGIDLYWIGKEYKEGDKVFDNCKRNQIQLFEIHLELAKKYKLPVSIHSRGAEQLCLEIVRKHDARGIFHSYTGNLEVATGIIDAGWGLGVNGIYTFPSAEDLRDVYKSILGEMGDSSPVDFYKRGIYFETDAPYLSPQGYRGQLNVPERVRDVFEAVVENSK